MRPLLTSCVFGIATVVVWIFAANSISQNNKKRTPSEMSVIDDQKQNKEHTDNAFTETLTIDYKGVTN